MCCLQIFTRSVLLLTVGGILNACILCSFQVLLLVDASFGFEMETFEFLNILQAHDFPKVMGVLTHLDRFKNQKALKKIKKAPSNFSPGCQGVLSVRAHSQPVPQGGSPQPRQVHLRDEV